ncbi:MAG: phosphoribosylformylglycinamidine cyclo-ligase [Candidatus Peregrinibacteria bacterium]
MTTYKEAGVDVDYGDRCSRLAYQAAQGTFPSRKGMIGEPVSDEGGFTGMLDMGDYYIVQNDDGVGTKIEVAVLMNKFDTLGYDLVAMVADDGVCVGAEIISVSNTLDANKLDEAMVRGLMAGLQKAASEQKIVVPGGELAELGDMLNGPVWNATAVGIVEKDKVITGDTIRAGDVIIGLKSRGIRSNGLTLARRILRDNFGQDWVHQDYGDGRTWGEVILTPSKIYHRALLSILGGYKEKRTLTIKGLAHNTGGGIRGKLPRLLKKRGFGAELTDLIQPHEFMLKLMKTGNVPRDEAYRTWNMGIGMMLISAPDDAGAILDALKKQGVEGQVMGKVVKGEEIKF